MSDTSDLGTFVTIEPDGDIVLVVGEHNEQFQVSSRVLSKASPVFKAMLGPNFREGQQKRSSSQPATVELPEDDSDGMRLILQFIHLGGIDLGTSGISRIIVIRHAAVALQKYQMLEVLRWPMQGLLTNWLWEHKKQKSIAFVLEAVAAAYLLGSDDAFQGATAHLITNCVSSVAQTPDDQTLDLIPARVLRTYWRRCPVRMPVLT
ncbi:unnamed protein product [Cercospora beticola]|nr:unnamed protein product [Cercospora beticola]